MCVHACVCGLYDVWVIEQLEMLNSLFVRFMQFHAGWYQSDILAVHAVTACQKFTRHLTKQTLKYTLGRPAVVSPHLSEQVHKLDGILVFILKHHSPLRLSTATLSSKYLSSELARLSLLMKRISS